MCVCELDVRRTQVQAINFNEKHLHFDFRKTQGEQKHDGGAARGKGVGRACVGVAYASAVNTATSTDYL